MSRIRKKRAKWKYELIGRPDRGPVFTTYSFNKASGAFHKRKRDVSAVRVTHLDSGLSTLIDHPATLEYWGETLIAQVGEEHEHSRRFR